MDAISWFDLIIGALVLLLGVKGLMNGFIKEVFGIIGLIGGVIVASRYASEVGELVSKNIFAVQENFWFHLGFLVTLIVFWLACLGLGQLFSKMLSLSGFTFLDRLLGFIIGSAKIFLVFAIFVFIVSRIAIISEKIAPYAQKSVLYPILLSSGEFIMNQSGVSEQTGKLKNDVEKKVNESLKLPDINASDIIEKAEQLREQNSTLEEAQKALLEQNATELDANQSAN